ncbi:MAG: MoxR family ATPase [Chromatiales bacterium]|nr:MoxR family ATPase [Chromatiales bacterium]
MSTNERLSSKERLSSIERITDGLGSLDYIATSRIATSVYLAGQLEKPILVEGPAGVGKTELAKTAAAYLDLPLTRLQCYEGLDESKALYEWKYAKQLLYTQVLKDHMGELLTGAPTLEQSLDRLHAFDDLFFSERFLEPRPLLKSLREPHGGVLLIDEIDKSDEEFEAFLLEILSDFQVTIPEIGTIEATIRPLVILTSNGTREMSDALKRRCLHLFIPYPDRALEAQIVAARLPEVPQELNEQLVSFVHGLRELDLRKHPSIAETIDWAKTLMLMHAGELGADLVRDTLNVLLKFEDDIGIAEKQLGQLLATARQPYALRSA